MNQHKEFVGHTSASISQIYRRILGQAKAKKIDASLQDVAEYAAAVYQPGTVVLNGGQVGVSPNLAKNSILMVLVHLNVHQ